MKFYYSSDWPGDDPDLGTWNELGTGEGLQKGGTEPENGVICDPENPVKYVKFTVPSTKPLTGLENGEIWYVKIFSYSRR